MLHIINNKKFPDRKQFLSLNIRSLLAQAKRHIIVLKKFFKNP